MVGSRIIKIGTRSQQPFSWSRAPHSNGDPLRVEPESSDAQPARNAIRHESAARRGARSLF